MWQLGRVYNPTGARMWFSDGGGLWDLRGGSYASERLIVENQGFLDFLEMEPTYDPISTSWSLHVNGHYINHTSSPSIFDLVLSGNGSWTLSGSSDTQVGGYMKPLPEISVRDVDYIRQKIRDGLIPYPQSPEEGKTSHEIRALGKQYFPFSPYSYELAMVAYDWTTASFARMVLPMIFEYTSIPQDPSPIDRHSLAVAIYNSSWSPFIPSNPDFMRSFLMAPAKSLDDVLSQLDTVLPQLQEFSLVENRLLLAALLSLPRTSALAVPTLYSGQIDISQLNLDQFAAEFHQFTGNAGPEGLPLSMAFNKTLANLFRPGSLVTTKQAWSFSDSMDIALHYQNGIILVARPPHGTWIWDIPGYVTPLSFEDDKIEWVFPPGTSFDVESVHHGYENGTSICTISLRVVPRPSSHPFIPHYAQAPLGL